MNKKSLLAGVLAVSMTVTMLPSTVFGMAEPATLPEINYFNDFSSDRTSFSGATGYMTFEDSGEEMFGQALAINPVKDLSYINVNLPMTDSRDYSLSFDFKAQQEDHPLTMFTQESGNVRIAAINYDVKGNLVINSKAGSFINASGNYSTNANLVPVYVGKEWTNITMHFHPAGHNTTIDWYINGDFVVTATASNVAADKVFTGGMGAFHFGTTTTGTGVSDVTTAYDGNEQFLIDNFKIEYLDSEFAYSRLNNQVGTETDEFQISFSEPLDTEITADNISIINTETQEEINAVSVDGFSDKTGRINIKVDESFTADTEYYIAFPESVKGASGRKLFSDRIYFVPAGVLEIECPTITQSILKTNGDCEDLPEGSLEALGKEKGNWSKYLVCDWVYDISAENTGTEENPNLAICFAPDHTSTQFMRLETNGSENSTFIHNVDETTVVWSMDVMRKELKRSYPLTFIMGKGAAGSASVGMFFFDSYGNFVFLNGSGDWWSTEDKNIALGEEYSAKQTAYQAEIEAGEWANITAVIDSKNETVTYFVDSEYAGVANWPSNRKGQGYNYFSGMRINPDADYRDGRAMYFDNYKLGYAKTVSNKKVTSFRLIDRFENTYGPLEQNVTLDIRSLDISFNASVGDITNAQITLEDANGGEIALSNIQPEGQKVTVDVNECLKKDMLYTVTISGIKTADCEDIQVYENSFNTTADGEFTVTGFGLRNSDGEPVSDISEIGVGESVFLNVSAINTTDDAVSLNASLTSYNNAVLSEDKELKINVAANSIDTDENIEITISSLEDLYIVATLTDENKKPIKASIELGDITISEDSWTLLFEDTATPNSKGYAEIQAPENSASDVVYRGQITSDSNGAFKVFARLFDNPEIENDAKSGTYTLSWTDENGKTGTKTVGFANINETKTIADAINDIIKAEDKETAINSINQILSDEGNRYALGIAVDNTETADSKVVSEIIYNYAKDTELGSENAVVIANKAYYIREITSGKVENLFEKAEVLEMNSSKLADFYTESYVTEELEKAVTKKLSGKGIQKFSDFYDILEESFVLAVVENPDGEANLKKVMQAFSEDIGIVKNGTDKAYRAVMYNTYGSYEELKTAFNVANKNASQGSSGGSVSGGGGKMSVTIGGPVSGGENVSDKQIPYPVFSDIEHLPWAQEAITRLAEMQIVSGKGDNKFYPNDNITRAEFVKIVVLAFEYANENTVEAGFGDVPSWAKEYVNTAFANELVSGYSDKIFGSSDLITRQDLVTIAYRAAVNTGEEYDVQSSNVFSDSAMIADYAKEAVHKLFNIGVISGVGNGEFAPKAFATRAEAAKIIYNMIMN